MGFRSTPTPRLLAGLGLLPTATAAPGTVAGLLVDEGAESNLLSWTPPAGASGIRVLRSTNPYQGFAEIAVLDGSATSYNNTGLSAGTVYYYRVIAFNAFGVSAGTGETSGLALTHLQDWRKDKFGTIENSGSAADDFDFEPDGIVNLLEFALGGEPKIADSANIRPPQTIGNDGSVDYLEITFRRRSGSGSGSAESVYSIDGIAYTVETSSTLQPGSWTNNPANLEQIGEASDNGAGTESVTVRIKPAITTSSPTFVRLSVE